MEWLSRLLKLLFVLHEACSVLVQLAYLYCGLVGVVIVLLLLTLWDALSGVLRSSLELLGLALRLVVLRVTSI